MVRTRSIVLLFLALTNSFTVVFCQNRIIAPIERDGFRHITSYDSLQTFLNSLGTSPGIQVEQIAASRLGRKVSVVKISSGSPFGTDAGKLRVLIFAQQHGDEPSGKEALLLLLAKFASEKKLRWTDSLDILIVPQMNPDGAELRQRRTSDSVDLNRNHLILTSPETKGLHDLFHRWKPEVTLDIHEFASGKEWRDSGMIKIVDVQLGMLTHPNTSTRIRGMQHQGFYPFIAAEMKSRGYRFHEYIVGSPDTRIRHSTTEINDGRQSFGILNSISFIQEGLKRYGLEDSLRRRAHAQLTSVEAFLEYCARNAGEIRAIVKSERSVLPNAKGTLVALRTERAVGPAQMIIPVYNIRTKKDTVWNVVPYQSVVETHLSSAMPSAYVVPKHLTSVIDLLERHHIKMEKITTPRSVQSEAFTIDSIGVEIVEEDPKPKPFGRWNKTTTILHPGDVIVRTDQLRSFMITIALEPESVWGLIGYAAFETVLKNPGVYPIFRAEP